MSDIISAISGIIKNIKNTIIAMSVILNKSKKFWYYEWYNKCYERYNKKILRIQLVLWVVG